MENSGEPKEVMEIGKNTRVVILILVIVVILTAAFAIYRARYQTEEERDEHRGRFIVGAVVLSGIAVLIYALLEANHKKSHSEKSEAGEAGERPEYGFREAWREMREQRKAESDARSEAKKAGLSSEEADRAARKAKADFRQVKRAGQEAAFKAREAERAKLGAQKP